MTCYISKALSFEKYILFERYHIKKPRYIGNKPIFYGCTPGKKAVAFKTPI